MTLTDSYIIIDNSFLESSTTCPQKAYLGGVLKRRANTPAPALRFGGIIHSALAYRYRKEAHGTKWSEDVQMRLLSNRFAAQPCELEGYRNCDNACKVIRGYNRRWSVEDFKVACNPRTGFPFVEQPFAIDTGHSFYGRRVIYSGRIDLVYILDGRWYVLDFKTSAMGGDAFWSSLTMAEAPRGYCWAIKQATGIEPQGYTIRGIFARESLARAQWDELTETLVMEKSKSGKASTAVPLELAETLFCTATPPGQLDSWFTNMLQQVETFLWHVSRGIYPRHHYQCVGKYGACEYFKVCELTTDHDREALLASDAYTDNTWSALYK